MTFWSLGQNTHSGRVMNSYWQMEKKNIRQAKYRSTMEKNSMRSFGTWQVSRVWTWKKFECIPLGAHLSQLRASKFEGWLVDNGDDRHIVCKSRTQRRIPARRIVLFSVYILLEELGCLCTLASHPVRSELRNCQFAVWNKNWELLK